MKKLSSFKSTLIAAFGGYIVQGIVNTFVPLLFVTFQNEFSIPLTKITALITINFLLQLCVDLASAFLVDKIGYRICAVAANTFAAVGLVLLTVLPNVFSDAFIGLLIAVAFYAVGGGLLEVVVSPIVEACPSKHKDKTMSLLHSFYSWGSMGVIAVSAAIFAFVGTQPWRVLTLIWAIFPACNAVFFLFVPLATLAEEGTQPLSIKQLLKTKYFWLFAVLIMCAGAAEGAIAQWASVFAEEGLKVSKTLGDLFGAALFALTMAISRTIYGKFGDKMNLRSVMTACGFLLIVSYVLVVATPSPVVALCGIALSGFGVGIMWPGTYSLASARIKGGGNAMFALLALAGDFGCTSGPSVVGYLSGFFNNNLKIGILFALIFPVLLTISLLFLGGKEKKNGLLKKD